MMKKPLYGDFEFKRDIEFVLKKFNLSSKQFDEIINSKKKKVTDYSSNQFLFEKFEFFKNIFRSYATKV